MNTSVMILSIFLFVFVLISIGSLIILFTTSAFSSFLDPSGFAYRMGDAFYVSENLSNNALAAAKNIYPNSLVAKSNANENTLVNILKQKYYLHTPETIVHLRLGDLTPHCKNRPAGVTRKNINIPAKDFVIKIKKLVPDHATRESELVFITGNHRSACVGEMKTYLNVIRTSFPTALIVENGNSFVEADNDFVRMVSARTFLRGRGGYGLLVENIRSKMGKKTIHIT